MAGLGSPHVNANVLLSWRPIGEEVRGEGAATCELAGCCQEDGSEDEHTERDDPFVRALGLLRW